MYFPPASEGKLVLYLLLKQFKWTHPHLFLKPDLGVFNKLCCNQLNFYQYSQYLKYLTVVLNPGK